MSHPKSNPANLRKRPLKVRPEEDGNQEKARKAITYGGPACPDFRPRIIPGLLFLKVVFTPLHRAGSNRFGFSDPIRFPSALDRRMRGIS